MSLFDILLVLIIGGFAAFGLWFGLIHTLGSLIGTILGVFLASRFYAPLADWLVAVTGWAGNFPKVIIFILAFVIINRLVGLAFFFIDKALSIFTKLPFIKSLDRLLGCIFGIAEGALVCGIVLYFIYKFPLSANFMTSLGTSHIAPYVINFASILWPLVPEAINLLQNSANTIL